MAVATISVSGLASLRYVLAANTQFYFTNAVDGQVLRLTIQQPPSGTGPFTVSSGNCPGILQVSQTAGDDTTMSLTYDALNNTWNNPAVADSDPSLLLTAVAATGALAWTRGLVTLAGAAAITVTVTNPVAGPPGVGNDGEVMWFTNLSAHAHAITMATSGTVNGVNATITTAGAVGNAIGIMAFGVNVYIIGASGALTLT